MDLYQAAQHSAAAFDYAAPLAGGGWLAALRAAAPAALLEECDDWVERDPWRATADIARWAKTHGLVARLAVYQACLRTLREDRPSVGPRLAAVIGAGEAPWLWAELFAAVPLDVRSVVPQLEYQAPNLRSSGRVAAMRHVLGTWAPFPHRIVMARMFLAETGGDLALALRWLGDQRLRSLGLDVLRPRARDVQVELTALLATASTDGARKAALELLRTIDPRIGPDGERASSDEGELEGRLRAAPADVEASLVWADLMSSRGDPRGEHVALDHGIAGALAAGDPARAAELSAAQAAHVAQYRAAIWRRPGGVPFRDRYRGRACVGFNSGGGHHIRGKAGTIAERAQKFVNHMTTATGPRAVFLGSDPLPLLPLDTAVLPPTPREAAIIATLGGDAAVRALGGDRRAITRTDPAAPLADPAAFLARCRAEPDVTLVYAFTWTWPGTRIPLPYQEGAHYADGEPLACSLHLHCELLWLRLSLQFPFESLDDAGLRTIGQALHATLGSVLTPSRFVTRMPSADGAKLVTRLARLKL